MLDFPLLERDVCGYLVATGGRIFHQYHRQLQGREDLHNLGAVASLQPVLLRLLATANQFHIHESQNQTP